MILHTRNLNGCCCGSGVTLGANRELWATSLETDICGRCLGPNAIVNRLHAVFIGSNWDGCEQLTLISTRPETRSRTLRLGAEFAARCCGQRLASVNCLGTGASLRLSSAAHTGNVRARRIVVGRANATVGHWKEATFIMLCGDW